MVVLRCRVIRAFSSEVETGARQENASNQESRAPFRFNRNGKGSREQGRRGRACSVRAMLSVPTLWTVSIINFLALGLIWAYVARSYPKLEAARFWTGSAFAAAFGASLAMLRFAVDSLLPLLIGGTVVIFATCPAAMGIKRFYDQPISWRATALITGLSFAGLTFFIVGYDSMSMRIFVYSLGQALPFALTLKLLLARQDGRIRPGRRLAGTVGI